MPDCLNRWPTRVSQAASVTPDPIGKRRRASAYRLCGVNNKACAGMNWASGGDMGNVVSNVGPYPNSNNGLDKGNGFMCRNAAALAEQREFFRSFAAITDGTSNTFALGEAVPRWCTHTWWWWFNGTTATCAIPLNYKAATITAVPPTQTLESNWGNWQNNYSFMSKHPGGGQFAMVDASVKFVPNTIDLTVYRNTATIMGNEVSVAGSQ